MYKIGEWINSKAEKKAEALKLVTDKSAADLRIVAETTARDLKQATEDTAEDLKKYTDSTAVTLKGYTDKTLEILTDRIATVDNKVMTMLQDLADRSDIVNGNVANIRNDIIQVQEDIADLYSANDVRDDVERDRGEGRDPLSARKNTRRLELERRRKRREIEEDKNAQEHPLYGKERSRGSTRTDSRHRD